MISNLGPFAHPKKRGTITAAKRKGQSAPKVLPGANQRPVYPAAQNKYRAMDANVKGPSVVNDVGKVSATPGSNTRQFGTIAPGPGTVFGTVNQQPATKTRQLTHQRASKPMKMKKSGKEKRSDKLPFVGM